MTTAIRSWLPLVALIAMVSGCGSYPLPRTYVLGSPLEIASGDKSEAGWPVIELRTVSVPDYLDSTDIVRRVGPNEVHASEGGRWGDRLSIGVTRALTSALAKRLTDIVVTNRAPSLPSRRVFVEIERFEIDKDGRCVLTARWQITAADNKIASEDARGTFVKAARSNTDAEAASAMTAATDALADQIALAVRRSLAETSQ